MTCFVLPDVQQEIAFLIILLFSIFLIAHMAGALLHVAFKDDFT